MRRAMQVFGYFLLSIASVDTIIAIIDWFGRWDWFRNFMLNHPYFASVVKTPFQCVVLIILGFFFLEAERRLKEPRILARYVNARWAPDLHSATMQDVFEAEHKTPGWDERRFDWDWFIEIQLVNDSDTPTTIDNLEASIGFKPTWWSKKQPFNVQYMDDLGDFDVDMTLDQQGNPHGQRVIGDRYSSLSSPVDSP
jgi:hypothetical protein